MLLSNFGVYGFSRTRIARWQSITACLDSAGAHLGTPVLGRTGGELGMSQCLTARADGCAELQDSQVCEKRDIPAVYLCADCIEDQPSSTDWKVIPRLIADRFPRDPRPPPRAQPFGVGRIRRKFLKWRIVAQVWSHWMENKA